MSRLRETRRVAWDGPHPAPGDYLARRHGGLPWLIQAVRLQRATGSQDTVVTLDLMRPDGAPPWGAVVHPASRTQVSDPNGPPRVRQLSASGATAVMTSTWRDPTDTMPNASRQPRRLTGFRTFCPLRRIAARPGGQITDLHILAADVFRSECDLARFGRVGVQDGLAAGSGFGPSLGPSARCVDQANAAALVQRVLSAFPASLVPLLNSVVLGNQSLFVWCSDRGLDPKVEMGRLVCVLDLLVHQLDVVGGLAAGTLEGAA